jgi:hypothetical protein
MSKIDLDCAPPHAEPITAAFDASCACIPRPGEPNTAIESSRLPKCTFFTLRDFVKLQWLSADLVTKGTTNPTLNRGLRSYDDHQAHLDRWIDLARIASEFSNPSVSRLAAAVAPGRNERLILSQSDKHTRGPRLWQ